MHELEVPLALAGLQVDADEAFGEEVVAGAMAAVVIGGRRFDRKITETELFIDRDLRPHADVAVARPRFLEPRVVAEITRARNRVELPDHLAGADVERADDALGF